MTIQDTGFRIMALSLSGVGTKHIPTSRPQIVSYKRGAVLIFRDEESGNKVSAAINKNIRMNHWQIKNLVNNTVGSWEPTYDTELWKQKKLLHLFVQYTDQKDAEGKTNTAPQPVQVLEVNMNDL